METLIAQRDEQARGRRPLPDLFSALERLDRRLERAVAVAQRIYGPESVTDPFRGLYIHVDDLAPLLAHPAGAPTLAGAGLAGDEDPAGDSAGLRRLRDACSLSAFDLDLVLIALAPEVDLRYERLYAYLQNDVTRRRPSVDLALNLLCASAEEKLAQRAHFAADAPLIRHKLIHLIPDPNHMQPPLLAHYLKLDAQIVEWLLGQASLDARLAPVCRWVEPGVTLDQLPLPDEVRQSLVGLVTQVHAAREPLRLYFQGGAGSGTEAVAEAVAEAAGARLLAADVTAVLAAADPQELPGLLVRAAWFEDAVLYFDRLDVLRGTEQRRFYEALLAALGAPAGIVILAGEQPWSDDVLRGTGMSDVITVPFPMPNADQRRQYWHAALAATGTLLPDADLYTLAARFRLTPDQIAAAVHTARGQARRQAAAQSHPPQTAYRAAPPTLADLFAGARAHSGQDLAVLAHKIEPGYTWADLVLPPDALAQLHEIGERVAYSEHVLNAWGFGRKLAYGKGITALFVGPSGTGKTMAAEVIAHALGLDLYKIDLAGVVSKYIGETEKNLDRIFTAAEHANAILFFDEADALFGKRSEVRDSHDRYANIEISYLLQKMERYEGVAILATNLRGNLDEAFVRRMAFTVHFPFPDEAHRRLIWAGIWPATLPRAAEVDLDFLAAEFKLSGGNIKNIALASAFLAAAGGGPVAMTHLRQAIGREYQKLGRMLTDAELVAAHAAWTGRSLREAGPS